MKPRACEIVLHVSRQLYGQISNSKFLTLEISFSPRRRKLEMLERILFRLSSLVLSRSNAHCVGQGRKIRGFQASSVSTKSKNIATDKRESNLRTRVRKWNAPCVYSFKNRVTDSTGPKFRDASLYPFFLFFFLISNF